METIKNYDDNFKNIVRKITHYDIENFLGFKISEELKSKIDNFDLKYRELFDYERDNYILNFVNVLTNNITKSGEHRILEWESGWKENLDKFKETKNIEDLIPKYHGKNNIVRLRGDIFVPLVDNFDYKIHICIVDAVLQHYFKNVKNIFEFGCGPAYHLIRLNNFNKNYKLSGSDWTSTSQEIIKEINSVLDTNINYFNFDFFRPDYNINIPENSGIYTVAALEQVGENFKNFIDFLLEKKPEICVHLEPIDELLDNNKLMDSLSIKYFRKRNYLKGFLPYLENLEKDGKIEIINKKRTYSGSYFIEGHSLIVWRVKK